MSNQDDSQLDVDAINDRLAEAAEELRAAIEQWYQETAQRPIHRVLRDIYSQRNEVEHA